MVAAAFNVDDIRATINTPELESSARIRKGLLNYGRSTEQAHQYRQVNAVLARHDFTLDVDLLGLEPLHSMLENKRMHAIRFDMGCFAPEMKRFWFSCAFLNDFIDWKHRSLSQSEIVSGLTGGVSG
jgi:hypothetical protein